MAGSPGAGRRGEVWGARRRGGRLGRDTVTVADVTEGISDRTPTGSREPSEVRRVVTI